MAMRTKTVEYAFLINNASLATATRVNTASITLTIPETTSRTFLSCEVDVMCENGSTGGTQLTARLIGISVAGVAFNDQTITQTIANASSANYGYHFSRDVTSHFTTNFGAGTTATCQVGLQFTGPTTLNHTVKLYITYSYDDAAQDTRVKTVRIPLDSKTSGLTATAAAIGTSQIPNLSTFCPEATKTFLRMWVQVEGNNGVLATTAATMTFKIDTGGTTTTTTASLHTAGTNYYTRYLFDCSGMTTTATHNVFLNVSTVNSNFPGVSLVLYVTYSYSHNSSTSVLNSLVYAMSDGRARPGIDVTNPMRYAFTFNVPEASPALAQSGIMMYGGDTSMTSWNVRAGAQAYRTYTITSGQFGDCGESALSWRIDSGGAQGAGLTLVAGSNTITVDTYSASTTDDNSIGSCVAPMLYLNYTSAIDTLGEDAHTHTTMWSNRDGGLLIASVVTNEWTPTSAPAPADTNYWIQNLAFHPFYMPDTTSLGWNVFTYAQVLSTENKDGAAGPGWMPIQSTVPAYMFSGAAMIEVPVSMTAQFRLWPSDTTKPDVTANRKWRSNATNNSAMTFGARVLVTYQALARTESGTVSNFTGTGASIVVDLFSKTTKQFLATTTTAVGGTFSFTVPAGDTYYTVSRQDSTHTGRSDDLVVN